MTVVVPGPSYVRVRDPHEHLRRALEYEGDKGDVADPVVDRRAFMLMDTNGDGELSESEVRRAQQMLDDDDSDDEDDNSHFVRERPESETYVPDPNEVDEDPPLEPLEKSLRWGALAVAASYVALFLVFRDPQSVIGHFDPVFRDTYKFSFGLAALCALYVLNTVRTERSRRRRLRLVLPVRVFLAGAALWVPTMFLVATLGSGHFYSSIWYVVGSRLVAAIGLGLLAPHLLHRYKSNNMGMGMLYYLLFHVCVVDGMVWNISYVMNQ